MVEGVEQGKVDDEDDMNVELVLQEEELSSDQDVGNEEEELSSDQDVGNEEEELSSGQDVGNEEEEVEPDCENDSPPTPQ